jgi:hypothetical protein
LIFIPAGSPFRLQPFPLSGYDPWQCLTPISCGLLSAPPGTTSPADAKQFAESLFCEKD